MKAKELEKGFSPIRLALLIRNHAIGELPSALIAAGIAFGVNLVGLLLGGSVPFNAAGAELGPSPIWGAGIAIFGIYLASRAFSGMHGSGSAEWILLPASPLEKYLAALAWILVIWPIGASVVASACSGVLALLAFIGKARQSPIWTPFNGDALQALEGYLIMATVMLAGSAVFAKRPLIKTLGIAVAAVVASTLVAVAFANIVLRDPSGTRPFSFAIDNGTFSFDGKRGLKQLDGVIKAITGAWCYGALPLFALVFSYFRVTEKEARDAVQ